MSQQIRQSFDINKELFVNPSRYRCRVRVRAGARESFFFFLNVVKILSSLVGSKVSHFVSVVNEFSPNLDCIRNS